jgi:hypothetical protein
VRKNPERASSILRQLFLVWERNGENNNYEICAFLGDFNNIPVKLNNQAERLSERVWLELYASEFDVAFAEVLLNDAVYAPNVDLACFFFFPQAFDTML